MPAGESPCVRQRKSCGYGLSWALGNDRFRACGIGLGTVYEYLEQATVASIGWPLPKSLSDEELEAKLFESQPIQSSTLKQRPQLETDGTRFTCCNVCLL